MAKQSLNSDWKLADKTVPRKFYKSSNVTEDEFAELKSLIKTLKTCETYQEYKPAFWKFCKYCHIAPEGTIIVKIDLKSGSKVDHNSLTVEYAYNNRKIKLDESKQLFHISKVEGIKELTPFFRGKSERGFLYDKPRIYFTVYEKMPRIMADYGSSTKINYYKVKKNIGEAYVDPLLPLAAQGAVYIETNKSIPVEEMKK